MYDYKFNSEYIIESGSYPIIERVLALVWY